MKWIKNTIRCSATVLIITTASVSYGADQPINKNTQPKDTVSAAHEKKSTPQASASAYFPELKYEFEAVVEGIKATHDFMVQNKGTAVLKIKNVRTG